MPRRFRKFTRRSLVLTTVGLAFAAVAGAGLAAITSGASLNPFASEATSTQVSTSGRHHKPKHHKKHESESTTSSTTTTSSSTTTTSSSTTTTSPTTSTTTTEGDAEGQGQGQQKADVCHMTGSGKSHTINIAMPAVPAHLAHGDTMGACAQTPTTIGQTTTTTPTTSTVSTTSTTTTTSAKKPKKPKKHEQASGPNQQQTQHASGHGNGNAGRPSHGNSGHGKSGTSSSHGKSGHGKSGRGRGR